MSGTGIQRITFMRDGAGQWMLRVPADQWTEGAEATVTRSDGTTARVVLGDWFEELDGGAALMVAFEALDPMPVATLTRGDVDRGAGGRRYGFASPRSRTRPVHCITGGDCSSHTGVSCGAPDCDAG